jgi:hypothetical protein
LMVSRLRSVSGRSVAAFVVWKTIHGLRVLSMREGWDAKTPSSGQRRAFAVSETCCRRGCAPARLGGRTLFRHGKHSAI